MSVSDNPQEQLAWEARQRLRAAVAAALAAVLTFGGQLARGLVGENAPNPRFLDGLEAVQAPGTVEGRPSLQLPTAEYLADHALGLILSSVVEGIGFLALAYAVTFLGAATRARRRELVKFVLYLPAIGGVLMAVSSVLRWVGRVRDANALLDGPGTVASAQDIGLGGMSLTAEVLTLPAVLALAAGILLISLNAMRAGLLTRFMGILGAIVGGLQVIQFGPQPLVRTFWLLGLALVFAGRRPGGELPAWRTGREEPWPSQREMAESRRDAAAARRSEQAEEPEPVATGAEHPSANKRKRKRRG